jgi:hypothetical protein
MVIMVTEKFCRDCSELRPVSEFTRDRARRDGLSFYCRTHSRQRLLRAKDARQGPPKARYARDRLVPDGHRWCPDCGTVKPLDEFVRNAGQASGRGPYCRPCHNIRGKASTDKVGGSRTYHLKRRYGITAEDADAMLADQGGLCVICKTAPANHVDHDHATGAVRALLCFNCNGGLGQFKDNAETLHAAAYYVAFHTARQEIATELAAVGSGPEGASRPGGPPVGSQRRPGTRGTNARGTGRTSTSRRQMQAGEADE